jgi:outer membrane biosynthesis protein TonB
MRGLGLVGVLTMVACSTMPSSKTSASSELAGDSSRTVAQESTPRVKDPSYEDSRPVASAPFFVKRPYRSSSDDSSLTDYKKTLAANIERAGQQYLHPSRPQEPLRAVIVFELAVNRDGKANVKVLRAPYDEEMQRRAKAILQSAEPFPVPPNGKTITFTETMLFDWQGRFRVRTRLEG